jgi:Phage minor structural protein GP20.
MENIYTILEKETGITIPEDKKANFEKSLFTNYKTVSELENLKTKLDNVTTERDNIKTKYDTDISSRDNDLSELKEQLKNVGGNDKALQELQGKFDTLTNNYATEKTKYEQKLADQRYEFAVREKVNGIKFTSNSAKKAFLHDVMDKKLQMDGDTLLGFDDYVNSYKEQDSGAFYVEKSIEPTEPKPVFSSKTGNVSPDDKAKRYKTNTKNMVKLKIKGEIY